MSPSGRRGRRLLAGGTWPATCLVAVSMFVAGAPARAGELELIWHVETAGGKVLDSRAADRPVNPASVVKLATTLLALDTLGTEHRFATTFGTSGPVGKPEWRDLVVHGGADPDFHFENAMVVARALREAGLRRVRGEVYVGPTFWMGWERGTAGREPDPVKRRRQMGERLAEAWAPGRWNADQRESWRKLAVRRGWAVDDPPAIDLPGRVSTAEPPRWSPVVQHQSEPLLTALRRFNVFSNNDIERLDASIGSPAQLTPFLEQKLGSKAASTSFSTSSGLNRNRMTPRLVVGMLRELDAWLRAKGHSPADVMPILGCGESTLPHLFPGLGSSGEADGLVGKTGTLGLQDGGVSALAGYLPVGDGLVFFVAAPGSGKELWNARAAQEAWVKRVLLARGGVAPLRCPPPVPTSDELARVSRVDGKSPR